MAFLACLECGAVAAPLNYRLSAHELEAQIALLKPRLVLADEAYLEAATPGARCASATLLPLTEVESAAERARSRGSGRAVRAPIAPRAPALISFTSGSTGTPKGAVITHGGLAAAAGAYAEAMATGEADRTLVMVPLFHNTGFCDQLAHMLMVGGVVDLLPSFGVATAREALLRRPSTFLMGVPGILRLLATGERGDEIFAACRIACYGGSPMPEAWIGDIASRWPHVRLYNSYGLTEFTSVSHLCGPADAGRPRRHRRPSGARRRAEGRRRRRQRASERRGRQPAPLRPEPDAEVLARSRAHARGPARPLARDRRHRQRERGRLPHARRPRERGHQPRR